MSFIANIFRISGTVEFQSLSIGFEIEVLAWKILQKFFMKKMSLLFASLFAQLGSSSKV